MANVAVTCIKNGRSDSFGRPLVSGTYYPSVEIETAKALWNSGYVSVADASVFDQDPLAGTSPLDDFNIARALSLSRQPEQTRANIAAELAAIQQSQYLRLWLPGDQGTGNALDLSGGSSDLVPAGTMTTGELWATPLQMSFPGGTGKYAECPAGVGSVADIDLLTTSVVFSCRIKKAAPGSNEYILGRALQNSWMFMLAYTSGTAAIYIRGGNNEETFSFTAATGVFDNTWKHLVFAFDSTTKTAFFWVDKKLTYNAAVALTKSTSNITKTWPIGSSTPDVGSAAYALEIKDVQIYTPPSVVSVKMQRIVRKLYSTALPLSNEDFV